MTGADLILETDGNVVRIWHDRATDGGRPVILIEAVGIGKRYIRVQLDPRNWLEGPADETWHRSPNAILLCGDPPDAC